MGFTYMEEAAMGKVWKELADKHMGHYQHATHDTSDPLTGMETVGPATVFRMTIPYGGSQIEMRVSDLRPLVVRFKFTQRLSGEFTVTNEGMVEKISKWFGTQDVELGVREFDRKYLVKSDAENWFRQVFDHTIVEYLVENNIYEFTLHEVDGEYELYFAAGQKRAVDLDKMDALIQFIAHAVFRIIEINDSL